MKVRKLADGVTGALINRAGHLAPLHVHNTKIHIGGGNGRRQRFVTVANDQNQVRFEALKFARLVPVDAEVMPEHITAKATMKVRKWMPKALCV